MTRLTRDERLLLDMIGGEGAEFTKYPAGMDGRTFEVRCDGRLVGVIEVDEQGEVSWVA